MALGPLIRSGHGSTARACMLTELLCFGRSRCRLRQPQVAERVDPRLGHFIVTRGEDMWLKMVLKDGFLHADLHPGNILVHVAEVGYTS